MRRRGSRVASKEALPKPDIRTLFILFILSYLSPTTPTSLKSVLLEEHKDLFTGIFKGIADDPYDVIRRVLEVSWEGVWCDHKLPRTVKIRLFGESCLAQVLLFFGYDRLRMLNARYSTAH
jgi:nucleolar pre-ribosomal-associated protein 1